MRLPERVRWLAVPIAVYLAITIVLPAANGAAHRADFVKHLALVLVGCGVMIAIGALAGFVFELFVKGDRS
jgi:hypothetical protein